MLHANELMVGDLVTFRDSLQDPKVLPIKIIELHGYDDAFLAQIGGCDTCDELEFDDDIVGIPLTPEILEKNGFIYNDMPFASGWEQFGLALYLGGDGYRINCGQNVAMIIDSVHDLQHALRLCEIDKEITL